MVTLLNDLSDYSVVQALGQLKEPKKHIRGRTTTKTNQLNINIIAETITDGRRFVIKSLLDCGSTSSAVNRKWVERNNIPTRKVIIPVQVYNANGNLNAGGPITDYVTL